MRHFIYTAHQKPNDKSGNSQTTFSVHEVISKMHIVCIAADMLQGYRDTLQAVTETISANVPSLRKVPRNYVTHRTETVNEDRTRLRSASGFSCTWAHRLYLDGKIKLTQI